MSFLECYGDFEPGVNLVRLDGSHELAHPLRRDQANSGAAGRVQAPAAVRDSRRRADRPSHVRRLRGRHLPQSAHRPRGQRLDQGRSARTDADAIGTARVTHSLQPIYHRKERNMATDQAQSPHPNAPQGQPPAQQEAQQDAQQPSEFDGLEGKKPAELTPEELRLMADTMPGEGPGD